MTGRHILVSGKVQGVFFRASAQKKAIQLALLGTVKNLPDGRVDIIAEGESEALDEFIAWCWEGSFAAKVNDVQVSNCVISGNFAHFNINDSF